MKVGGTDFFCVQNLIGDLIAASSQQQNCPVSPIQVSANVIADSHGMKQSLLHSEAFQTFKKKVFSRFRRSD
jgi:hypothetical protein